MLKITATVNECNLLEEAKSIIVFFAELEAEIKKDHPDVEMNIEVGIVRWP